MSFCFFLLFSYFRYLCLLTFIVGFLFPFPVFCLCLFLCFLLSFSFFVSFYCFYFFLDLPSVAWFSLHFQFLFLPPSLPSFPYISLLFVPGVGLSSFSSSPSFSPSFLSFLFPFGYAGLSVSSLFSFPAISLFLVRLRFFPCPFFSTSCWLFFLWVWTLSSLLCSSFSFLSSLPFSLSCLLLFLHLLPLVPVLVFSTSSSPFLFPCHLPFLLPWLRPLSLPSSLCFPIPFSFCFFLWCLLFRFGCFSSSSWLSSPSSPPSFRSSSSSVSPPLHTYSSLSVSASRWFSLAHPLVCLSCSVVSPASIFLSSSSSPVVFVSSLV